MLYYHPVGTHGGNRGWCKINRGKEIGEREGERREGGSEGLK